MRVEVNGVEVHASIGGRETVDGRPWLIFLHGAGASHVLWSQQSRSFAYGGHNVLAPDFPGHNLSGGEPLDNIDAQADWVLSVMDALSIKSATMIGHSQGGLVALMVANKAVARVEKIVFVATAAAIPVSETLLENAKNQEARAKSSMTAWGLGPDAHMFDNTVPGFSHPGVGLRIMDFNRQGVLETDLRACAAFEDGIKAAKAIKCPTLCVLAGKDRMIPVKFGKQLAAALPDNTLHVIQKSGHTLPLEYPRQLNVLIREFLKK